MLFCVGENPSLAFKDESKLAMGTFSEIAAERNLIRVIKSSRFKETGRVAHMRT
jgi:hypothetical protein